MNELKENLKQTIKETYGYFEDHKHFSEVDDAIGHCEDALRMYDVGYVRALEMVMRNLEELTVEDYD